MPDQIFRRKCGAVKDGGGGGAIGYFASLHDTLASRQNESQEKFVEEETISKWKRLIGTFLKYIFVEKRVHCKTLNYVPMYICFQVC